MGAIERIRTVLSTDGTTVVVECRRCGKTVESGAEACPYCGPEADIVTYEIP